MGDSYRDFIKGGSRVSRRAGQAADTQAAIEARAKAIREKNRKKAASELQMKMRLDGC